MVIGWTETTPDQHGWACIRVEGSQGLAWFHSEAFLARIYPEREVGHAIRMARVVMAFMIAIKFPATETAALAIINLATISTEARDLDRRVSELERLKWKK